MISRREIEIMLSPYREINYEPESLEAEIIQNVNMIFLTSKYSVPMDREFGLDVRFLDQPMSVIEALLSAELAEAIEKYEPRVKVLEVKYDRTRADLMDGHVRPVLRLRIKNTPEV